MCTVESHVVRRGSACRAEGRCVVAGRRAAGPARDFRRHAVVRPRLFHGRGKREIASSREKAPALGTPGRLARGEAWRGVACAGRSVAGADWKVAGADWKVAGADWKVAGADWKVAGAGWKGAGADWKVAGADWKVTEAGWKGAGAEWRGAGMVWSGR
ncbi:Protein of unknown function [Gryllus bimaculatus]|nr:Protein of unknown function [Gryllus bimaculatus]